MTIGCESLQALENNRAGKNDTASEEGPPGICKSKKSSESQKNENVFEMNVGAHTWSHQERRQSVVNRIHSFDMS